LISVLPSKALVSEMLVALPETPERQAYWL
jgi:hypothetical protein